MELVFFHLVDLWGLNSGYLAWWQAPLPFEPLCQPLLAMFLKSDFFYYYCILGEDFTVFRQSCLINSQYYSRLLWEPLPPASLCYCLCAVFHTTLRAHHHRYIITVHTFEKNVPPRGNMFLLLLLGCSYVYGILLSVLNLIQDVLVLRLCACAQWNTIKLSFIQLCFSPPAPFGIFQLSPRLFVFSLFLKDHYE